MPYITQSSRELILDGFDLFSPGDVNYILFKYMKENWTCYGDINGYKAAINFFKANKGTGEFDGFKNDFYDLIVDCYSRSKMPYCEFEAALDLSFDEFYHRFGRPYEIKKMEENGDV
jgi:hypothetical protein